LADELAMLRILFLGDIMGEAGRKAVIENLDRIKKDREIDFIIVNGENSAGGRGITPKISIDLLRAGAAVITTGDHIWDQPDVIPYIDTEPRLLRPLNFPPGTPGSGSVVLETKKGKVGVINVQGRTFMKNELENPFLAIEAEVEELLKETPVIFVDCHAEATSEKVAMGRFLDGKVSAVVGTHTHVQTADERVFPGGTAFLCDAGMCGPIDSVIGSTVSNVLRRFTTSMPAKFYVAKGPVLLCGAVVDIDEETGKAFSIERFAEKIEPSNGSE
jgi:metallophosphoesterase (TIGR00282 family)